MEEEIQKGELQETEKYRMKIYKKQKKITRFKNLEPCKLMYNSNNQ